MSSAQFVNVYMPGFKTAVKIHPSAVAHLPAVNPAYYVLCSNYDAAHPESSCRMLDSCKFVHADISAAREHPVHVNFAWRTLESCTYERFPAGTELHVATPNCNIVVDVMDSCFVLKTKALQGATKLTHCAHYYFNRTCNMGSDCHFVHAVFVDPNAMPGQRAPVPSQMGDGREAQLSKRQREAALGASKAVTAPVQQQVQQTKTTRRAVATAAVAPAPVPTARPRASLLAPTVLTAPVVAAVPRSPSESGDSNASSGHRHVYRRDPYSLTQPMTLLCCA